MSFCSKITQLPRLPIPINALRQELPFATEIHGGFEALEQDRQVSPMAEIGTSDSNGLFALCSGFNST